MKVHRMLALLYLVCLFSLFPIACADTDEPAYTGDTGDRSSESSLPENDDKVTIAQGIWGNVWLWQGNHMPSTDKDYSSGTITPVKRDILIYERTAPEDAEEAQDSDFYSQIHTALVSRTASDVDGFYEVALPPGDYSLLIREDDRYYAPVYGENGHLNPVTVAPDSVTRHQVDITYQAVF